MNKLEATIQADLVSAMKNRQDASVAALRSVKTAIQNEKVNGSYHELTDDEIVKLIQKLVKQRQESIEIYTQAGRTELADREQEEMLALQKYLPAVMTEEELKAVIDQIIEENHIEFIRDMAQVMKILKEKYPNQYDGKVASNYTRTKLKLR